jgi:uncharacterized coiled-coil protein SlyX
MIQNNKCDFENGTCSVDCKKYSMCAYMSVQKQLSELQKQIEFIYQTINSMILTEVETNKSIESLQDQLQNYTCELLDLYYTDSETNKESQREKESK